MSQSAGASAHDATGCTTVFLIGFTWCCVSNWCYGRVSISLSGLWAVCVFSHLVLFRGLNTVRWIFGVYVNTPNDDPFKVNRAKVCFKVVGRWSAYSSLSDVGMVCYKCVLWTQTALGILDLFSFNLVIRCLQDAFSQILNICSIVYGVNGANTC